MRETVPTLHGKGRRRLPLPRPSQKNHTSWLSSFLFVIYSHDVVPTFSLSSYFGSFEILLTWYLCVGFSRSQQCRQETSGKFYYMYNTHYASHRFFYYVCKWLFLHHRTFKNLKTAFKLWEALGVVADRLLCNLLSKFFDYNRLYALSSRV